MRVVALIPAHNEADRIAATVVSAGSLDGVVGVIVVDDASRDETRKHALEAGAVVARLPYHQGKGAALEHAAALLAELTPFGPMESLDAVILIDADLASSTHQASVLLAALKNGADMAIAILPPPNSKVGFGRVKKLAHETILELGGFDAQAPLSGQRALTIPCLKAVRPFAQDFGVELAMTVRALWAGMQLIEVPTTMAHRSSGNTVRGFLHRFHQYLDVAQTARELLHDAKQRF